MASGIALRMKRLGSAVLLVTLSGVVTASSVPELQRRIRGPARGSRAVVVDFRSAVLAYCYSRRSEMLAVMTGPGRLEEPTAIVVSPMVEQPMRQMAQQMARYGLLRVVTSSLDGALRWASSYQAQPATEREPFYLP
jgi:hypothetical protein